MSNIYESLSAKFQTTYEKQVERELEKLDKRSLETVMRLIDLEIHKLGPQALLRPDRAAENAGKAQALNDLHGLLWSAYSKRFITSEEKKENPDE